jgi:hypothetical protein
MVVVLGLLEELFFDILSSCNRHVILFANFFFNALSLQACGFPIRIRLVALSLWCVEWTRVDCRVAGVGGE